MADKHGNLSINSNNIFPIIKKWMYSDKDIFIREVISNSCDAITKLMTLSLSGEYDIPEDYRPRIEVVTDDQARTLTFYDNGIGMTAEEVEKYITDIAFSGATEFLEKYKDKTDDDQIIGHFGLGFYSTFMVADDVHIDTLSYKPGSTPVHWECDGSTEYDMGDGERAAGVGTTVTLYLNEDNYEFCNEYKVKEVIEKYCAFMPYEIYLHKAGEAPKTEKDKDGNELPPQPVNDPNPLWNKHPNECVDDEYKEFYRKVFNDYKEPLFWIHLNMDYPFNLKGILYFPRINMEYDAMEGVIKLYNNQVFVADNIKEVIPDYLLLLKGIIDCPDIPLNVSRSALQNDGFVKKISDYISKKVADKLSGLCKTDRGTYEKYWDDIQPFVKYGCIRDDKFKEKMMDYILYKDIYGTYVQLKDIAPVIGENDKVDIPTEEDENLSPKEKEEKLMAEQAAKEAEKTGEEGEDAEKVKEHTIYYVTNLERQGTYVTLFKDQSKEAVIMRHNIDPSFIQLVEQYRPDIKFARIDSGIIEEMQSDDAELKAENEKLQEMFRKVLDNKDLKVEVKNLKADNVSSMLTVPEEDRRMMDMMKMYGVDPGDTSKSHTLVLNNRHPLVQYLREHRLSKNANLVAEQLYDLALLKNQQLSADAMEKFVERSNEIMLKILK